jgi:ubiquinone/menaquinone biosynthesis C-methylase UbiE
VAGRSNADTYRKMVENEWVSRDTVESWARWHDKLTIQGKAVTERLATHARILPGIRVLDLACGTGDPAISLARLVGPKGMVTATDLSAGMVEVARANASRSGARNIDFREADMQALPFADASFDAVTSKIGIMYAVDLPKAVSEIRRVLSPGGRMAFAVLGPPDQGSYLGFVLGRFFARRGAGQSRSGASCGRSAFGRGRNGCVAVALAWLAGRGLDAVLRCGGAHASLPRQFLQRGTRRRFRGGAGHAAAESHAGPYGTNGGDELCLRSAVVAHAELQLAVSACERNYACPLAWLASRSPIEGSAVATVAERPQPVMRGRRPSPRVGVAWLGFH